MNLLRDIVAHVIALVIGVIILWTCIVIVIGISMLPVWAVVYILILLFSYALGRFAIALLG